MSDPGHRLGKAELIAQIALETRAEHNDVDEFDDAACELLGVNRTALRCLDVLGRHELVEEEPMTAGALAEATGLTTGAVTAILDRLEAAGYIRRTHDAGDRRRVFVSVTAKANRRSGEIWGPLGETFRALHSRYSVAELELLLDYLRRGRELHAEHLERVKGMAGRSR